jgi:CHAT domain-containing protein
MREMEDIFESYGKRGLVVPAPQEKAEEQKFQAASATVADKILVPLMPKVRSSKNWIVSPDSSLWAITWAALWIRDNQSPRYGHYLLESRILVDYVVTSRDLIRTPFNVRTTAPLIMANPDYDLGATEAHSLSSGFAERRAPDAMGDPVRAVTPLKDVVPLPETETEAKEVAKSLKRLYPGIEPQLLLGKYALAARFKSVHNPKVVYLSTHGFFFPLKGADEGTYQLGSDLLENPLLRCGLAMASCNHGRPPGATDDSGWLTGTEIVGTDLRGTDLVVLSACETGLGDVWAGQSAAGLRQAFELAGAKSVVASLWSVPSAATADLMAGFMDGLASRKPKGQALADSELTQLHQRLEKRGTSHPFYWGGFTLTGDWR